MHKNWKIFKHYYNSYFNNDNTMIGYTLTTTLLSLYIYTQVKQFTTFSNTCTSALSTHVLEATLYKLQNQIFFVG